MKMLFKLMKEIEETSKIPFKLKKLVGDIYASPNFCPKDGLVQATLKIANEDFIVEVAKEDERVLPLLSSYIKTNIKKLNDRKYNIILEVIDGKNIEEDELSKVYPFLMKEFQMLYIYTEKSFEEVFSIVQNGYSQDENVVMEYEGKILVLGILDDIYDHAESLFETITSDIGGKIIISYCNIDRYSDLGDALKSSIKKIDLVKKFNIDNYSMDKVNKIREEVSVEKSIEDEIVETLVKNAEMVAKDVVKERDRYNEFHKKIDKLLVSKITGIPIMIVLLLIVLWITITLANYPSELLSNMFGNIEVWLRGILANSFIPSWISSVLIDGIYVTLAWVISVMLPPMAIFFPMFTLLEDLGYLPRIAFNLDKCFKKCCSCGKQALTMCMGLGCNAAGVIGCRIINSPRERLIAILTNVFMPCNGRFPTLITVASLFIEGAVVGGFTGSLVSALAVTAVIIVGVFMTLITSKILSKTVLKGVPSNFILELPPYRKPQIGKVLVRSLLDRTLYVLGRAVAVAAPAGIVIWIFANVPVGEVSLLTYCADLLQPFANAIGLDGYILMAFILGLPANEIVMPIIIMSYMRATTMLEFDSMIALKQLLVANGWTLLTAINMMIICLMHYPCGTTLWTIKKETKSWKWTILSFLIPTIAGIVVCFITTQLWRLIV